MREEEIIVIVMTLIVLSGVTILMTAMMNRRRIREMEHRERLAMIERGLIPSPESDPTGFEAAAGMTDSSSYGERFRTAGVLMIGIGLGLMVLISFTAGEPSVGIGVGGAFALLGGASLLNYSLISKREDELQASRRWKPPVARRPEPPPPNGLA